MSDYNKITAGPDQSLLSRFDGVQNSLRGLVGDYIFFTQQQISHRCYFWLIDMFFAAYKPFSDYFKPKYILDCKIWRGEICKGG